MKSEMKCGLAVVILLAGIGLGGSGCGSSSEAETSSARQDPALVQAEQEALQKYRWYLERKATSFAQWSRRLWGQLAVGHLTLSQSRHAIARVQFSQLQPVPLLIPKLDQRIDGQIDEREGAFIGFHRIEQSIYGPKTTDGMKLIGKDLAEDAEKMHYMVKTLSLTPPSLMRASQVLLDEIVNEQLRNKTSPYSPMDMIDVSAGTEGVEAAFEAVRPILVSKDSRLVLEIEARFSKLYDELAEVGQPARQPQSREPAAGILFVWFSEIPESTKKGIARSVGELNLLFAKAGELLASS